MGNLEGFDATTAEDMSFTPLPDGSYKAIITESKMKPTKDGSGEYLELAFQITVGEFEKRKLWARLNLKNKSAEAVKFAKSDLSKICKAVNIMRPTDSSELHNAEMEIKVKTKPGQTNPEIVDYLHSSVPF